MKSDCPNDHAIQTYAFQPSICDADTVLHVVACEKCKLRVNQYVILSEAIEEEVYPQIGIDIASLVLEKVGKDARKQLLLSTIMYALIAIPFVIIASLIFQLRETIGSLFISSEAFLLPFVMSISFTALILLGFDIARSYRVKERMLD